MTTKKKSPPFLQETEAALLKRALGFEQEELYSEDIIDKSTGEIIEEGKRKRVRKWVPPDVRALLFWLKNRYPDRWRDHIDPDDDFPTPSFDDIEKEL